MKNISLYVAFVYIMQARTHMEVRGGHWVGCWTHLHLVPLRQGFSLDTDSTASALADWAVPPAWKPFLTPVLHCSKLTVSPESQQCSVSFFTESSFSDWPVGVLLHYSWLEVFPDCRDESLDGCHWPSLQQKVQGWDGKHFCSCWGISKEAEPANQRLGWYSHRHGSPERNQGAADFHWLPSGTHWGRRAACLLEKHYEQEW